MRDGFQKELTVGELAHWGGWGTPRDESERRNLTSRPLRFIPVMAHRELPELLVATPPDALPPLTPPHLSSSPTESTPPRPPTFTSSEPVAGLSRSDPPRCDGEVHTSDERDRSTFPTHTCVHTHAHVRLTPDPIAPPWFSGSLLSPSSLG